MAHDFLNQYREDVCPLFPFAIVPPNMTSAQLRAQRPFFWKAAMVGACRMDGPRQSTLGELLLKEIVLAAYTEPERRLDLLQSLQVLLVWCVKLSPGLPVWLWCFLSELITVLGMFSV